MISKDKEADILRLFHAEKWKVNTIATQLGIHHSTVQRVLAHAGIVQPLGKPRPSIVDPYMPFIVETLTKYPGLPASRVFEMVRERGYRGASDHFRHIVSRVRPRPPAEAFLRLRTLPGEQGRSIGRTSARSRSAARSACCGPSCSCSRGRGRSFCAST